MAQKSHSQVSHNRLSRPQYLANDRPFVKRCYFRFGSWSCQNTSTGAMAVRASAIVMLSEVWGWKRI
jgi:hypothetical protein